MRSSWLGITFCLVSAGCASTAAPAPEQVPAAEAERAVRELLDSLAADLAQRGPLAWMDWFDRGSDFAMASDGKLVFPSIEEAERFLRGFAPEVASMELTWSDVRVDAAPGGLVLIAAAYDEVIVRTSGEVLEFGGYVTAVAVDGDAGWRLRRLHWSSPRPMTDSGEQ